MGPHRPTLDTVAEAAGVSRMTVSNAYNRPDQLSAATRERVLAVARDLGYPGPNPAGRSLRRGQSGAVGVLLSEGLAYAITDPGLVAFMRGVATELGAAGKAMLMVPREADPDGALVRNANVDAFILCALAEEDPAVAAVRDRRIRAVVSGSPQIPGIPFVGIDNRAAGELVARHLLELGHVHFGVIGLPGRQHAMDRTHSGPPRLGVKARIDGFLHAVEEAGLDRSSVAVRTAEQNSPEAGRQAARELLEPAVGPAPTAIFGVTDVVALGALVGVRDAGLSVPRDVSVVGFDDIVEASTSSPALTTVAQSLFEQGVQAARLALALMAGTPARSPRISAELVMRHSTAAAPTE